MTNPDNVGGLNDHKPVPLSEELRIEAAMISGDVYVRGDAFVARMTRMAEQAERLEELCRAAPAGGDSLRLLVKELRESLEGVVRVADRNTDEFGRAREAIARASHVFVNAGDSEVQFIADGRDLNCPACGGSGHVDDSAPAGSGEVTDGCTESNCERCATAPHARGELRHAGIGSYPDVTHIADKAAWLERAASKWEVGPMAINPADALRLRELAALLRKLQQGADGWRPIESAPKDCRVFLYSPAEGIGVGRLDGGFWTLESEPQPAGGWQLSGYFADEPSHWQPLPEPPASQGQEGGHARD